MEMYLKQGDEILRLLFRTSSHIDEVAPEWDFRLVTPRGNIGDDVYDDIHDYIIKDLENHCPLEDVSDSELWGIWQDEYPAVYKVVNSDGQLIIGSPVIEEFYEDDMFLVDWQGLSEHKAQMELLIRSRYLPFDMVDIYKQVNNNWVYVKTEKSYMTRKTQIESYINLHTKWRVISEFKAYNCLEDIAEYKIHTLYSLSKDAVQHLVGVDKMVFDYVDHKYGWSKVVHALDLMDDFEEALYMCFYSENYFSDEIARFYQIRESSIPYIMNIADQFRSLNQLTPENLRRILGFEGEYIPHDEEEDDDE